MALDYEQLLITNELSEIIRWHNQCLDRLRAYRENYPYLIAPNVGKMMEENLKENVQMLYRELNNLHKPKSEQRRHVCRECHSVFAVSLPGGICDQCRSRLPHITPEPEAYSRRIGNGGAEQQPAKESEQQTPEGAEPQGEEAVEPQAEEASEPQARQQAESERDDGGQESDEKSPEDRDSGAVPRPGV